LFEINDDLTIIVCYFSSSFFGEFVVVSHRTCGE
jgi:hypothetical protein